ncbi:hypothetical protein KQX54_002179 [Cotesia glomerata]|uniref:Uncharacterized protein n=1 Tax=Cotesia glomerata TaxID=32391 RepID=A0AAV7IMP9_COTGL|nr:hypothetical protein KQX54_002179 [Cotesia glomerata]
MISQTIRDAEAHFRLTAPDDDLSLEGRMCLPLLKLKSSGVLGGFTCKCSVTDGQQPLQVVIVSSTVTAG